MQIYIIASSPVLIWKTGRDNIKTGIRIAEQLLLKRDQSSWSRFLFIRIVRDYIKHRSQGRFYLMRFIFRASKVS